MRQNWKKIIPFVGSAVLLLSSAMQAQVRRAPQPVQRLRAFSVTPYLAIGFQNTYYDGLVQFSDGSTKLLTIDPGSDLVLGAQVGYRVRPRWSALVNVATSSPEARFVEDGSLRPDLGLRTTQLEAGLLYDVSTFPMSGKVAPLSVGGGLSLTVHSVNRFSWDGNFVEPQTTSIGLHGLAALDIPLSPRVNFHGQTKLVLTPLSRGDLENKIALADGKPAATLDGGTSTYFVISAGVTFRP